MLLCRSLEGLEFCSIGSDLSFFSICPWFVSMLGPEFRGYRIVSPASRRQNFDLL